MDLSSLEDTAQRVEWLVEKYKRLSREKSSLLKEKQELERKVNELERRIENLKKEEQRLDRLLAENKANKRKIALLRSRIISMLAKLEILQ